MTPDGHVVIVGGGPGGLCAAMLLAARGLRVTLLEKQPQVGGRSGALALGEYSFDLGSTMLMMRASADRHPSSKSRRSASCMLSRTE